MALSKTTIELQIEQLLSATGEMELEKAKAEFKKQLAQIIMDAIKSATITIPSGTVNVVGSASAQSNPAPIVVSNGIS